MDADWISGLEPENQCSAGASEVELCVAQRDAEYREILERVEVANVAADPEMRRRVNHQAATKVPTQIGVVRIEQRYCAEVDVALHDADAARTVRSHRTDLRSD